VGGGKPPSRLVVKISKKTKGKNWPKKRTRGGEKLELIERKGVTLGEKQPRAREKDSFKVSPPRGGRGLAAEPVARIYAPRFWDEPARSQTPQTSEGGGEK